MDTNIRITDCYVRMFRAHHLSTTDSNFLERSRWLEKCGYTVQSVRDEPLSGKRVVYAKPNEVMVSLVDESGNEYHDINLYDIIRKHSKMKRLSKKYIRYFIKEVNEGNINLIHDSYSDSYVIM